MKSARVVPVPVTPELAQLIQRRRELMDLASAASFMPSKRSWMNDLNTVNHLIALHFEVAMTLAYDRKGWTL